MPAREVDREVVGLDVAEFRRKGIGVVEDLLTIHAVQSIFQKSTGVSLLRSNPLLSNPLVGPMGRINYAALTRALVFVEPMPPGIPIIFDKDIPDAGA